MNKFKGVLIVALTLVTLIGSSTVYAIDLWGGTTTGGTTTTTPAGSSLIAPTGLNNLVISLFKNSDFGGGMVSDFYIVSGYVATTDTSYVKVKVVDFSTGSDVALKHSADITVDEYSDYCDNDSDTYDTGTASQSFTCSLSTSKDSLTSSSKIKIQFFTNDGATALAETGIIDLSKPQDGNIIIKSLVATVTNAIFNQTTEIPLDSADTDGDGTKDISDQFPSIQSSTDGSSPITITPDPAVSGSSAVVASHVGGDCSLNPSVSVNGAGWLLDMLIFGLPAALIGTRRKNRQ